ncbi:MAG TPA: site-specific integrase [Kofleriaceae bacterium]|jgi:integrase
MIKVRVAADGTRAFQVYERARVREKSIKVYVGSFASRRDAEFAEQQHRVTQRGIKDGELPAAVDHKRTMGDAFDAWLRAIKDQRSRDEYESRMRLYVRPTFDTTPLVKITKPKLIDLRSSLKEREEPIGNATINTLFAALSTAYSYFIEQGWCSENPLKFIRDLEVAERPFLWLQSAGEVQKLLGACNENIRTLVAVLVGTGMRLDEALHLMWTDIDLQHRVIHVHRGRRGAPKSGRLRHVPIFDSVLTVLREMKLPKGSNSLLWPGAKLDKFDEQLPRNKTSVFRPFKGAVLRAGLTKKLRLHDLRHTFAGLFLASGGDIFKLSKILGHSSVAITQQVYAHLHPDAFAEDYSRVAFAMPEKVSVAVLKLQR